LDVSPPTPPPPASDGEEEVPEVDYPEDKEENDRLEAEAQEEIDDMDWAISNPEDEEQAAIHALWRSLWMENVGTPGINARQIQTFI
jgi:hypothetical protein